MTFASLSPNVMQVEARYWNPKTQEAEWRDNPVAAVPLSLADTDGDGWSNFGRYGGSNCS